MTYLSDGLRARAVHLVDPDAGLMTAAAHVIDHDAADIERLVRGLARATKEPVGAIRLAYGLGDPGGANGAPRGTSADESGTLALDVQHQWTEQPQEGDE
jgi:hypothetical protein